ncbi:hypothetical protein DRQ26_07195, partial [bacterium]
MNLTVDKIILKHSDGVNKEPLPAELVPGELVINNVTGFMYQKTNNGDGDVISSTEFQNFYNVSPHADFTVPATANEADVINIDIQNYNASSIYGVNITGGSIDTSTNPFVWILPSVIDTKMHGISITSQELGKLPSKPTPYKYITVSNVDGIVDDAVILNTSNIAPAMFDTLTDASVVASTIIVSADDCVVETVNFEQEAEDADWSAHQTSVQVSHINLLNGEVDDLSEISVISDVDLSTGDTIFVKQEDMVKEVSIGSVEDVGVTYPIKQITTGTNFSLFLDIFGDIHLNGIFNGNVEAIANVKKISSGESHALAIKEDDSLWVIGKNNYSQLGTGDTTDSSIWIDTGFFVKDAVCSESSTHIILLNGDVYGCGRNSGGEIGNGNTDGQTTFVDSGAKNGVKLISSSYGTAAFLIKEDDGLYGSGYSNSGLLGTGISGSNTRFNTTGHTAKNAFMGYNHSFLQKEDNSIFACGSNDYGQFLTGSTTNSSSFIDTGLIGINVIPGADCSHIVKTDNTIWAGGRNLNKQLGFNDTTDRTIPEQTNMLGSDLPTVTGDGNSTFIIDPSQRAHSVGENDAGNHLGTTLGDKGYFTLTTLSQKQSRTIGDFTPPLTDNISYQEF